MRLNPSTDGTMSTETTPLRRQARRLLQDLSSLLAPEQDANSPAFRHLAIALLNLAIEDGSTVLSKTTCAFPLIGYLADWEDGALSDDELARRLGQSPAIQWLSSSMIEAALRDLSSEASPSLEDRRRLLVHLVKRDQRLDAVLALDEQARRDVLITEPELLADALELAQHDPSDEVRNLLTPLLPRWNTDHPTDALRALATMEESGFSTSPSLLSSLGERARQFELSLGTHLRHHSLLPALRAALAFAPARHHHRIPREALRRFLTTFQPLAKDPTLVELAIALMETRHRAHAHLRGAAPLAELEDWVSYLRGPCVEFAEFRELNLREATNFAHYAFHLLNLFDLATICGDHLSDPIRRALMDIEDEIKEWVLVGQRQGIGDDASSLERFDQARWLSTGPRARLADRLARLAGAWQGGHRPGPPGSPHRPDHPLFDRARAMVDDPSQALDDLQHRLSWASLHAIDWLHPLSPQTLLTLLCAITDAADEHPDLDPQRAFVVDLTPLQTWTDEVGLARLTQLLDLGAIPHIQASSGLIIDADDQRLTLRCDLPPQAQATLDLLHHTDDPHFRSTLEERLALLLDGLATAPSSPCDERGVPTRAH